MAKRINPDELEKKVHARGGPAGWEYFQSGGQRFIASHYPDHVFVRKIENDRRVPVERVAAVRNPIRAFFRKKKHQGKKSPDASKKVHFPKGPHPK